jgi:hypothetical protein
MTRRIVAAVTLTALVNLMIGGCSKVVNLKLDEVAVKRPNRIANALLFFRMAATITAGVATLILQDFLIPYRTRNFVPSSSSLRPSAPR